MSRPYDIVVLGATGTVGKLVCEHLAQHYQVPVCQSCCLLGGWIAFDLCFVVFNLFNSTTVARFSVRSVCLPDSCCCQGKVKWAMAARNKGKMEKVRQDLAGTYRLVQVSGLPYALHF